MSNDWNTGEIKIATASGEQEVRCLQHSAVRGLAVTEARFGVFDVTHITSGRTIASGYLRAGEAALTMAQLHLCLGDDWMLASQELTVQMEVRGLEPVPFEGCTITSGGTRRTMTKGEYIQSVRTRLAFDAYPWESESPMDIAMRLLE